jgi:DNA primase
VMRTRASLDTEAIRRGSSIAAVVSRCGVQLRKAGRELVGLCPFHKEKTGSFYVNPEKNGGVFHCHGCDARGDVFAFVQRIEALSFPDAVRLVADLSGFAIPDARERPVVRRPAPPEPKPIPPPPPIEPVRSDLAERLGRFQAALPGSWGEEYLKRRGVPLDVAQRYGLGYVARGQWPHAGRDWKWGRVVVPHHTPEGELVNLYGRTVEGAEGAPKEIRHTHLPGNKGYFNPAALAIGDGPLYICEGAFDALALIAAGCERTVAVFGLSNIRWDWLAGVSGIVFALDADPPGIAARPKLTAAAWARGLEVWFLDADHYGGEKDAAAAWAAGKLQAGADLEHL